MDTSPYTQRHNDIFTLQSSSEDIKFNFDPVLDATHFIFDPVLDTTYFIAEQCFDNITKPAVSNFVTGFGYAAFIYAVACIIDPLDK